MWLTKGVSDQDKQVVQREQYHFNEPPDDSTEDAEEYLAKNEILLTSGVSEVKLFNRDVLFAPCFFTAFGFLLGVLLQRDVEEIKEWLGFTSRRTLRPIVL
jgi:hypothetical protein